MSRSDKPVDATVPLTRGVSEQTVRRFSLVVEEGQDKGLQVESSGSELSLGTAAGNHMVLSDSTVSRHHCAITVKDGGFALRDLGSMNGTMLGRFRVELAYVKDKASIRLGRTKLRFRQLDDTIRQPLSDDTRFGSALGRSAAMRRIFAVVSRVAASDSTLLLEGETGTGKGLLAASIHDASERREGRFVVIDCAAIPASLVESELFGHTKGAFTGAHTDRAGAFEAAAGGTVFLDEIGELPLDMQPKLLRALEERVVKRVGGLDPIALDVRVIAATNRELRAEVNRGTFRADLYYRLNTVRIQIPPLRERREDIELLARHFYAQFSPDDIEPERELVQWLRKQDYPGNVRELRSTVERAVLLGDASLSDAPAVDGAPIAEARFDDSVPFRAAKERVISQWERGYLSDLLAQAGGNVSKAARMARMDRNHLRELLRRHQLD